MKFLAIFQMFCVLFIDLNECNKNKSLQNARCDLTKFEDSVHTIFVSHFVKNKKWPSNENETDIWCKTTVTSTKYVKSYADNCLKGLSKLQISVLASSVKKANKYICGNQQERKRFIDKRACANKTKDGSIKCWNKFLTMFENIKDVKIQKDKLPLLCCSFYLNMECVFNVYKKFHPRYCTTDNIKLLDDYLKRTLSDSNKIICSEYRERNKCHNYFDRLEKYAKSDVISSYRTHLPAIWKILETI